MTTGNSRALSAWFVGAALCIAPATGHARENERYVFELPAQDLGDALRQVAARAGIELYASAAEIEELDAPPLKGQFSAREAVTALLHGTSLTAAFDRRSVVIRGGERAAAPEAPPSTAEPIVVTGTRIEGAPAPAPVIRITADDIRNAGQADLGEVARSLPQNFGGGQNPGIGSAQGNFNENGNVNGASTFNLRGIGPNATLTLLNGNRFSYSGANSVIDVSAIPVAAVDRVEIVADGASAIYGADAVAGVVNILLRRDYEGLSTSARLGASTDGGNVQQQYNLLGGTRWSGGGVMATYDYFDNGAIRAGDRDYTAANNPDTTIYPALRRHSLLLSGAHELAPGLRLSIDALYKRGEMKSARGFLVDRPVTFRGLDAATKFETFGVAPSLDMEVGAGWKARIAGFYGTDQTRGVTRNHVNGTTTSSFRRFDNRNLAIEADIEGPLFTLPSGDVRLAAGGGLRDSRIAVELPGNSYAPARRNHFAYGELFVPLARPEQDMALVHRASLTAALRWEDYSDSGSIITPKLGFVYAPAPEFSLGISWGRSFKLPTLAQQYGGYAAVLLPLPAGGVPAGSTYMYLVGPNPDVGPERSENWTVSATFRPAPRLEIVTSLFHIDYKDRVAPPVGSPFGVIGNPVFADLLTRNPAASQLEALIAAADGPLQNASGFPYDPANVAILVDGRDRNIAEQRYSGADLSLRYRADLAGGRSLALTAGASWLDSQQRLLPGLPETDLAGTIFNPPHFRARGGVSFGDERFSLASFVSFSGGVTDGRMPVAVKISSVTTVDMTARIKLGDIADISLSALNILNAKPDPIRIATPGDTAFDTTNFSAAGRFLSLTISREW